MLALINGDTVIKQVASDGWVDIPGVGAVSPAQDGWSDGEFRLAEILPADNVPDGALVISTSVDLIDGQPKYVHFLQGDPTPLEEHKRVAKARIDEAAELARLKYITPGAGQAMTYQQKAAEAAACMADEDPQPELYPLLAAEVGITASTLAGVALAVSQAYAQWAVIGAAIEAARLGAKAAVDAAIDAPAVYAVAGTIVWP
ncbi:hypothetical protein [Shinella zoogloeoides]|uniref:hypothetical protein n=1 Tax=Shinella zoogloeoides TaxID=352475 RepID=UPI00299EAAA2|nr:hypothetical protein [Shinella zoogloeoides]WPE19973.1 hypothetical protein ShzoTeo12_11530 [Shinella zoogloeoides]